MLVLNKLFVLGYRFSTICPKDPIVRVFFYLGRMAEMLLNLRLVYLYVEGVAVIIVATKVYIPQR